MAAHLTIKSAIYLAVAGTLGYILMKVTEPSEEKRKKFQDIEYGTEAQKKKALFLKKIQEATHEQPVYLKKSDSGSQK